MRVPKGAMGSGAPTSREGVDWRRLLSERESTAAELSFALQKIADLEYDIDERRVALRAAERRRRHVGSSLRSALQEFCTQNNQEMSDAAEAGLSSASDNMVA